MHHIFLERVGGQSHPGSGDGADIHRMSSKHHSLGNELFLIQLVELAEPHWWSSGPSYNRLEMKNYSLLITFSRMSTFILA